MVTCFEGIYTKGTCLKDAFAESACFRVAFVEVACIASIDTVKRLGIHSQLSRILAIGLTDMLLKLGTGVEAS